MRHVVVVLLCLVAGTAVSGGEAKESISEVGEELAKQANRLSVDLLLLEGWSKVGSGDRASELDTKIRERVARCRKLLDSIEEGLVPPLPPPPPVDHRMSAARAYAAGDVSYEDWSRVVRVLVSETSEPAHVTAAASAIATRFGRLVTTPGVVKVRRELCAEFVPLLLSDDLHRRTQASRVLRALWAGQALRIAYDPAGSYRDRFLKTREWRRFLDR